MNRIVIVTNKKQNFQNTYFTINLTLQLRDLFVSY